MIAFAICKFSVIGSWLFSNPKGLHLHSNATLRKFMVLTNKGKSDVQVYAFIRALIRVHIRVGAYKLRMRSKRWGNIDSFQNPNDMWAEWKRMFLFCADEHAPLKQNGFVRLNLLG